MGSKRFDYWLYGTSGHIPSEKFVFPNSIHRIVPLNRSIEQIEILDVEKLIRFW